MKGYNSRGGKKKANISIATLQTAQLFFYALQLEREDKSSVTCLLSGHSFNCEEMKILHYRKPDQGLWLSNL